MGIRLSQLQAAAQRHDVYVQAQQSAEAAPAQEERQKRAVANALHFTSPAERLAALSRARTLHAEVGFGGNDLRPIRYLHVALLAARAVGKITVRGHADGEGDATGFLVAPGLLLTNQHVLTSNLVASASFVAFDYEDGIDGRPKTPKLFDLRPDLLYVADEALDYCFVAVTDETADGEPLAQFGFLRLFEQTGKLSPVGRHAANIVQHPLGQGKRIALRDNYFAEPPQDVLDEQRQLNSLFYGTDTLAGSSGSPVCTDEWHVVALHRGGVPRLKFIDGQLTVVRRDGTPAREGDPAEWIDYLTNEGTRVSRLYASLRETASDATHADQGAAQAVLTRLATAAADIRLGPVASPTAALDLPSGFGNLPMGTEEKLVRSPQDLFTGATGYRRDFLGAGHVVGLPELGSEVRREAAELLDGSGIELHYDHYTIVMHGWRRTALYAACNVHGALLWKRRFGGTPAPKRPASWFIDPRLPESQQPDDLIFSSTLQRGHLFKREDALWGEDMDGAERAHLHSMVITNATPMVGDFNNREWGDLEDIITTHLKAGHRLTYFAGPVFDVHDPYFNELKAKVPAGQRRIGMRIPTRFWKVAAWVEDGTLKAAGFILDQSDELRAKTPITEERLTFPGYRQAPIATIELRTGLRFPDLIPFDTHNA